MGKSAACFLVYLSLAPVVFAFSVLMFLRIPAYELLFVSGFLLFTCVALLVLSKLPKFTNGKLSLFGPGESVSSKRIYNLAYVILFLAFAAVSALVLQIR